VSLTTDPAHVTVRMYNVGFGDAFLLVFPGDDRPRRVLVDCGSHAAGPGPRPIDDVVAQIVSDVTDDDGTARIDLVVGTHRHRDHVSGFAVSRWDAVEVGEVWMPWTEDPHDPVATRIRERQSALAVALNAAVGVDAPDSISAALAANALTNASAMETLHRGFSGDPPRRFLPASDDVVTELSATPLSDARVDVRVLGPSRDEAVIRDLDPPAGAGYLRLATAAGSAGAAPFGPQWTIESRRLAEHERLKGLLLAGWQASLVRRSAEFDPFGLAVALEKAINGTSLVLTFALGNALLLFAGDAQWGTWKRILASPEAMALVDRATFLKVGHHGSHNATPRRLVEALGSHADAHHAGEHDDLWAMVSTRPISMWPNLPKPELLAALRAVTPRVARSDEGAGPESPGFASWTRDFIDAQVPI
jgi:hypothetical protein